MFCSSLYDVMLPHVLTSCYMILLMYLLFQHIYQPLVSYKEINVCVKDAKISIRNTNRPRGVERRAKGGGVSSSLYFKERWGRSSSCPALFSRLPGTGYHQSCGERLLVGQIACLESL